jgi:hypothetical protein
MMKRFSKSFIILPFTSFILFLCSTLVFSWEITTIEDSASLSQATAPSIAFDNSGRPAIAYAPNPLKLARLGDTGWTTEVVAACGGGSCIPESQNPSLAFDNEGNPGIASGWNSLSYSSKVVSYSHFDGLSWTTTQLQSGLVGTDPSLAYNGSPSVVVLGYLDVRYYYYDLNIGDWKYDVIGSRSELGTKTSMVLLSAGQPAIALAGRSGSSTSPGLSYVIGSYDLILDGWTWGITKVDTSVPYFLYPSIALQSSGDPAIAYMDPINNDLKYAVFNGAVWTIRTLESEGDVGYWASLAFDSDGLPGISYIDATNEVLKYTHFDGSQWETSIVDQIIVSVSTGDPISAASLNFSPDNNPVIAYSTNGNDLKYATVVPEPIRVIGESTNYYWSLQIAYDNAQDGDIIQAKAEIFDEDIYIDDLSNKSVILQGGFNDDFSEMTGMTSIYGNMMIYNGSISVVNIQLQQMPPI